MNNFKPAFGLSNPHFQTFFSTMFRKVDDFPIKEEIFELSDGDFLEAYWITKPKKDENSKIVTLFHGLEGSWKSPYIKGVMLELYKNGYIPVIMHFRGCAKKQNRLVRSYHSGDTQDAKEWFNYLKKCYPNSSLFGVGYSLGGNVLLKLLGEYKDKSSLKKAVVVSAPMDLEVSANKLNSGVFKIYQKYLMKYLKEFLVKKYKRHPMQKIINLPFEDIKKIKTLWEFDDIYTAPIHGFKTAKNYYKISSSKQYLKNIETQTLIIHSLDDPFMTPKVIPTKDEISSSVTLKITKRGGHIGFIYGSIFKPKYWLDSQIIDFFDK